MKRFLFTFAAAASLLVAIAAAGLWIQSYRRPQCVPGWFASRALRTKTMPLVINEGGLMIAEAPDELVRSSITIRAVDHWTVTPFNNPDLSYRLTSRPWSWIGIYYSADTFGRPQDGFKLVIAHRVIVLASMVLPAWWLFRWASTRNRHRAGHCSACGYDLRATPDRCPECGAKPVCLSIA